MIMITFSIFQLLLLLLYENYAYQLTSSNIIIQYIIFVQNYLIIL